MKGLHTFRAVSVSTSSDGLSSLISIKDGSLTSIQMSTAWTDAAVTFKGSINGSTTLSDIYTSTGGELSYTSSAQRLVMVDPNLFAGVEYLQLRSGTSSAPVAQAAARTLYLGIAK